MAQERPKFIVDENVGKLARWLRMLGFDAVFFEGGGDSKMVATAVAENRIILTRDTEVSQRRLARLGKLKVLLLHTENAEIQMDAVIKTFNLGCLAQPFTRCLEDNTPLMSADKEEIMAIIPPHIAQTQNYFMQCPQCRRVYWKGTHWEAMIKRLAKFSRCPE